MQTANAKAAGKAAARSGWKLARGQSAGGKHSQPITLPWLQHINLFLCPTHTGALIRIVMDGGWDGMVDGGGGGGGGGW